ncbi:MAG: RNB domain-containing ribonuclease [Ottowia sp.]|nr:RNB domain-containing ribonuclease [Ottowia sp.]
MHVLFDEGGKFLAGRILSEAEASAQVELDSGKRLKVKAANQLLRFEKPAPAELLAQAQAQAAEVELPLAWEFAPEAEFSFDELAADYFGGTPDTVHRSAMLMALQDAPHYFRRAGKGRFRKAPADIVAQALAAIEKKKQIAAQIVTWADELAAGQTPEPIREQLYKILFKPDKNAPEYKAVVEASRSAQQAPLALLQRAGAIESPYQFHWQRFLFENFPKGTGFPPLGAAAITDELPLATVQAFSIDDSQTTEIDDALSLQGLGTGTVVVGIHIAAPGLAIQPGDALDQVARARLSTVYMPGYKITMLPDDVVQAYTLSEGRNVPALSLYVTMDEATLEIQRSETRLERVPIAANLRHDQLDDLVTVEWLQGAENSSQNDRLPASVGREQLSFLYRLAQHLKAGRERVRGKPETFNRPDYNFRLLRGAGPSQGANAPAGGSAPTQLASVGANDRGAGPSQGANAPVGGSAPTQLASVGANDRGAGPSQGANTPLGGSAPTQLASVGAGKLGHDDDVPTGTEQVQITTRQRGAPLDLIVAEAMILANSTWGQWLSSLGIPGIYRSQASLLPGIKVRMGAKALPHAGIGVPSYAWSTSPLRRYVDLVNQWQIIAAAKHGQTAALAAPFKPKDAQLFAVISAFDSAYSAYNAHQASMERFWTLQYLRQQGITELTASLIKEMAGGAWLVRADDLPVVFSVMGGQGLLRGTRVRVKLGAIDDISLDVHGTVIEVLAADDGAAEPSAEGTDEDEDDTPAAGPLTIAVDVNEPDAASADNPPS